MANFDWNSGTQKKGGFYADEPATNNNRNAITDTVHDIGIGTMKLPGAIAGLADIPLGLAGFNRPVSKALDKVGEYTGLPLSKMADEAQQRVYSPERMQANQAIDQAWKDYDAGNKNLAGLAGAYITNPRTLAGNIAQSLPSMVAGGLGGKALLGTKSLLAPAVGEAGISAGQTMAGIDENVDPRKAAALSALSGAAVGGLGLAGGKMAQRFGWADPESVIGGVASTASQLSKPKQIIGGAASEGLLEELPQSLAEQGAQNLAEDKPFTQDMARAGLEGALSGGLMGAGFNVMPRRTPAVTPAGQPVPDTVNEAAQNGGTLSKALLNGSQVANESFVPDENITYPDGSTVPAYDFYKQRMADHGDADRARQELFSELSRYAPREQAQFEEDAPLNEQGYPRYENFEDAKPKAPLGQIDEDGNVVYNDAGTRYVKVPAQEYYGNNWRDVLAEQQLQGSTVGGRSSRKEPEATMGNEAFQSARGLLGFNQPSDIQEAPEQTDDYAEPINANINPRIPFDGEEKQQTGGGKLAIQARIADGAKQGSRLGDTKTGMAMAGNAKALQGKRAIPLDTSILTSEGKQNATNTPRINAAIDTRTAGDNTATSGADRGTGSPAIVGDTGSTARGIGGIGAGLQGQVPGDSQSGRALDDIGFRYLTATPEELAKIIRNGDASTHEIESVIHEYQPQFKNAQNVNGDPLTLMPEAIQGFTYTAKQKALRNLTQAREMLINEADEEKAKKEEERKQTQKIKRQAELDAIKQKRELEKQKADTKEGAYYVTAKLDGKTVVAAGPFINDHQSALDAVEKARQAAIDAGDPRAHFAAWGTSRLDVSEDLPEGKLNPILGINGNAKESPKSIQVKPETYKKDGKLYRSENALTGFTPEETAEIINSGAKDLTNYARGRFGAERVKGRNLNQEIEQLNVQSQNPTPQETATEEAVETNAPFQIEIESDTNGGKNPDTQTILSEETMADSQIQGKSSKILPGNTEMSSQGDIGQNSEQGVSLAISGKDEGKATKAVRQPWNMSRDEYLKSYPDAKEEHYDQAIHSAWVNDNITDEQRDRLVIRDSVGNKLFWAKTRKEIENDGKASRKAAKVKRAEDNKNPKYDAKWANRSNDLKNKKNIESIDKYTQKLLSVHKERVEEALQEGKPVPQEVLADYPDLQSKYAQPSIQPARPETPTVPQASLSTDTNAPAMLDSANEANQAVQDDKGVLAGESEYKGVRIYPIKMRDGDYFAVETDENKQRRVTGDRNRGGDGLFKTLDEAKKQIDFELKRKEQEAKYIAATEEAEKKEQANKADYNDVDGFMADEKPITRGIAIKRLNQATSVNGKADSIKNHVRKFVAEGAKLETFETDKLKGPNRRQWNNMDARQQKEVERKIKEAGKKTVYLVNGYDFGKTGYDYAQHLLNEKENKGLTDVTESNFGNKSKQINDLVKQATGPQVTNQPRAQAGGEIGPNGEFYKGGAFIATTDLPKKVKQKLTKKATGREQIEPGMGGDKWAEVPAGKLPLMRVMGGGTAVNPWTGEINYQYLEYSKHTPEQIKDIEALRDRWMQGERFVDVNEYPHLANIKDAARLAVNGLPLPVQLLDKFDDETKNALLKTQSNNEQAKKQDITQPKSQREKAEQVGDEQTSKPKHKITEKQVFYFEQGMNVGAEAKALNSGYSASEYATKSGYFKDSERNAFIKGFELAQESDYETEWRGSKNLLSVAESRGEVEVRRKEKTQVEPERIGDIVPKTPAIHIEGKTQTKATPAEINDALKKASERKSWSKTQMREWLVGEIDKAIESAHDFDTDKANYNKAEYLAREELGRFANNKTKLAQKTKELIDSVDASGYLNDFGQITFDVPGDGRFKVLNTKQHLEAFKQKVLASSGFKETRDTKGTRQPSSKQADALRIAQQYVNEAKNARSNEERDEALSMVFDIARNEKYDKKTLNDLFANADAISRGRFKDLYEGEETQPEPQESLETIFKSLGKDKQAKASDINHPQAELIADVQNNWHRVLIEHGYIENKDGTFSDVGGKETEPKRILIKGKGCS